MQKKKTAQVPKKKNNPPKKKNNLALGAKSSAPVATTKIVRTPAPRMERSTKNGDVRVRHREFIADIPGSVAFAVNTFNVNPGLSSIFPWLSLQAPQYESYRIERLHFEFQTMSSTATPGTVMAAIDYDPGDTAPTTKTQLAAYRHFVRSAPWKDFTHTSLREDLNKRSSYFVRTGPVTANQDVKLYDIGNLYIATVGQADTSVVGELYVEYDIKLMTPQLGNIGTGTSRSSLITYNSGVAPVIAAGSNAPINPSGITGTAFEFTALSPYNALVRVNVVSSAATATLDTTASTCTIQQALQGNLSGSTTSIQYSAQLIMLAGQKFSFVPSAGTNQTAIVSFGQFNSPDL